MRPYRRNCVSMCVYISEYNSLQYLKRPLAFGVLCVNFSTQKYSYAATFLWTWAESVPIAFLYLAKIRHETQTYD